MSDACGAGGLAKGSELSILHVTAPASAGGMERVVHSLATGHKARGHSLTVAAVVDVGERDHVFLRHLRAAGVNLRVLELPTRAYFRERRAIRELIEEVNPHIVHTHGYRPDVLHVGVARRCGIPVVTTMHGADKVGGRTRVYELVQMASFRRFDTVVAVSRRIHDQLRVRWVPEQRLRLIPNAWNGVEPRWERADARRKLGLPESAFVVGWVGRFIPAKGPDVLLQAAALLQHDAIVSVLGDGPESGQLEALARKLSDGVKVRFHGLIENAADYYRAFDVFVLSSRTEGTPVVLFEAMAAGVPIVGTSVGGVPDVVRHEREALLVPPEDGDALAAAITAIRLEPAAAAARASAALGRLREAYSLGPWLERYEDVYRGVIATHRASTRSAP